MRWCVGIVVLLWMAVPSFPAAGEGAETTAPVRLALEVPRDLEDADELLPTGRVDVVDWTAGEPRPGPGVMRMTFTGRELWIELAGCRPDAVLQVTAASFSSPLIETSFSICRGERPLRSRFLRVTPVFGALEVDAGGPLSTKAWIEAATPPTEAAESRFPVEIAPAPSRRWSALLPVQLQEPVLFVEGFVRHALRAPRPAEGGRLDFGTQRLETAASLLVRVVDAGGRNIPEARAELFPETDLLRWVRSSFMGMGEPPEAVESTRSDERGWARMAQLPAGLYRVQVTPGEAAIPTLSGLLHLQAGHELLVDRLVVPDSAALDVVVGSELLGANPAREWRITASGAASSDWLSRISLVAAVDENGVARFESLPPGTWEIAASAGNPTEQARAETLGRKTVDLQSGSFEQVSLELEGHLFDGIVSWLGRPVAASIQIRSPDGEAVASAASDEDRRFQVLLSSLGTYDVVVGEKGEFRMVPEVDFDDPEEIVEILLPEGEIHGVVVDGAGNPVDSATLLARQARSLGAAPVTVVTQAAPDGTFRLTRLNAGEWKLQASKDPLRSEAVALRLQEGQIQAGTRLVVSEGGEVEGQLLMAGLPLRNRAVWISCLWQEPHIPCGGAFRTDDEGRFSASLGPTPEGVPVNVLVQVQGIPLSSYRLATGAESRQLAVPGVGGRLVIELPGSNEERNLSPERLVLLNREGAVVPAGFGLVEAGREGGKAVTFPALSPGQWSLHAFDSEADYVRLVLSGGRDRSPLAVSQVVAGDATTVRVP